MITFNIKKRQHCTPNTTHEGKYRINLTRKYFTFLLNGIDMCF